MTYSQQDTFSIPEITVTANHFIITAVTAPNKIQVLNNNYLSSLNSTKFYDALNAGSSVFIKDYGYNTGIKMITLNSTQSEHTAVLYNGLKLNSAQNSLYDLSLLPIDDIEKIEISTGGNSSSYGSDAIGGVINIVPKSFSSSPLSLELMSELGSFGYKKFYGRINGTKNKFSYSASMSHENADNSFNYYFNNGFSRVMLTRENSSHTANYMKLSSKLKYPNDEVNMFITYSDFDRDLPPQAGLTGVKSAKQTDKIVLSGITLNKHVSEKVTFRSDLNYKYSHQKYYDPNTFNTSLPVNSFYKQNNFLNTSELHFKTLRNFELVAGTEAGYNTMKSNETSDASQWLLSAYTSGKYFPAKYINIYPSVRLDYISNIKKAVLNGKLGLNLNYNSLALKTSVSSGYRNPSFNELYWNGLGNPDLIPERSISFDAGIYYKFRFLAVNTLELSYYNITTSDRILWKPDNNGIWRPENISRVRSSGFDINFNSSADITKNFNVLFNAMYDVSSAKKITEDYHGDPVYMKQLIYIPQEIAKSYLMMNYAFNQIIKNISLNLFYSFAGKRYTDLENLNFVKYYELFDGNVSVSFNLYKVESTVKFAVNNILNQEYSVIPGYPMPLRNYKVQLSFKY